MLIRTFKQGDARTAVWLILIALLLWSDSFLFLGFTMPEMEEFAPLYRILLLALPPLPLLNVLMGFALLLAQVFLINSICFKYNFLGKSSWLPGFFYLVIMSSHHEYLFLTSSIVANLFLLLAFERMLRVFDSKDPVAEIFNVGMLFSIAGLIQYSSFLFVLWFLFILILYVLPSARTIAAAVTGVSLPLMLLSVWHFLNYRLLEEAMLFVQRFQTGFLFDNGLSVFEVILMFALAGLALVAIVRLYSGRLAEKPIRVRNRISSVVYFFIFSLIAVLFLQGDFDASHNLVAIPLSILIGIAFQSFRRVWIAELLTILYLLVILYGKIS